MVVYTQTERKEAGAWGRVQAAALAHLFELIRRLLRVTVERKGACLSEQALDEPHPLEYLLPLTFWIRLHVGLGPSDRTTSAATDDTAAARIDIDRY